MSERYSKLFSLPENLYTSGSPIVIAAGALLKDNQTGKVIAQLKLRNIGNKAIKAATVSIIPFDTVGNPLGEPIQYQYLDLNTERDNDFGSKSAISLPDITTRSFAATVTEIAFTDNSVWTVTESPWEPLSVPATISSIHGAEFAKQFCLEYGAGCKNVPLSEKDLWHCTCGALNHKEESHCHSCKKAFAAISSYNVDELNAKKNKRLADEKAKAEYEAEQARMKAAKNAKRAKKLAIIIVCVVAVLLLLTKAIIPGIKYSKADKLVKTGQYTEAIKAYKAIDDSEETQERIAAAHYTYAEALLAEEKYDKAASQFKNAGDYKDAKDRTASVYYTYAEALLAEEQYDKAVTQFKNAGDYKDAKDRAVAAQKAKQEQINANEYNKAEGMLALGAKVEAYTIFRELEGYQDSAERAEALKKELKQDVCIELTAFNTDPDDHSTILKWIPMSADYLHYEFKVVKNNIFIVSVNLTPTTAWPEKKAATVDWSWEIVQDETYSANWNNGYSSTDYGLLEIDILLEDTDIVIDTFTMAVGVPYYE